MKFTKTLIKDLYIIELDKHEDDRGFFARLFCADESKAYNLNTNIVQANMSYSKKKGTLRGLHYQVKPYAEAKFFRCIQGSLFDVVIDTRPDSPTYKQWFSIELSHKNRKMLYVPAECAHGFLTLEDNTEAMYMVTNSYNKESEKQIRFNDKTFNIPWPIPITTISDKDASIPDFKE